VLLVLVSGIALGSVFAVMLEFMWVRREEDENKVKFARVEVRQSMHGHLREQAAE
jgi:hypothetical protein